jgi:hypothetical protein
LRSRQPTLVGTLIKIVELGELGALRPRGREASAIEVGEGHGIATSMSISEFP